MLVVAWCATAIAGGGTGGRIGGGNWSTPSSRPTPSYHPSTSYTPTHSYTPPSNSYSPPSHSYSHSDTSSFGNSHSWSPPPTPPATTTTTYHSATDDPPRPRASVPPPSSYTPPEDHFLRTVLPLALIFGAFVGISMYVQKRHDDWGSGRDDPAAMPPQLADVDISVLRIAIDGRARKFVQTELARIARNADTGTDRGRVQLIREVALMLRRLRDGWVYGGAVNEVMDSLANQKQRFDHYVDDARVRFREETISNVQGVQSGVAPSVYTPRTDEGEGLILVSIIIAARRELYTIGEIGSGYQLAIALEACGSLAESTLVACEIIWQPSEHSDRMSSVELEAKYPAPELIKLQGALVGRVFCAYCSAPFPAELLTCPHCNAPAPGRAPEAT